jgi:hypothetical protein
MLHCATISFDSVNCAETLNKRAERAQILAHN